MSDGVKVIAEIVTWSLLVEFLFAACECAPGVVLKFGGFEKVDCLVACSVSAVNELRIVLNFAPIGT